MKKVIIILIYFIVSILYAFPQKKATIEVCKDMPVINILDSLFLVQIDSIIEYEHTCCCPQAGYIYVLDILEADYNKDIIQLSLEHPRVIEKEENIGCFQFRNKQYIHRKGYFDSLLITEEKKKLCFTKVGETVGERFYEYTYPEEFCVWTFLKHDEKLSLFGSINTDIVKEQ